MQFARTPGYALVSELCLRAESPGLNELKAATNKLSLTTAADTSLSYCMLQYIAVLTTVMVWHCV